MTRYTIDRFEGETAVLLMKGNETVEKLVAIHHLPSAVEEGDIIEETQPSVYEVRRSETEERRKKARQKLNALKNRPNSK